MFEARRSRQLASRGKHNLESQGDTERLSVLIVDDSEDIRHVLRLLFENEKIDIVGEANSGVGVLPLVLKAQPDFVILDLRMPRLNGQQTAEAIRLSAPHTRIVAFSAYLSEQPPWADAFMNKDRISQMPALLRELSEKSARS